MPSFPRALETPHEIAGRRIVNPLRVAHGASPELRLNSTCDSSQPAEACRRALRQLLQQHDDVMVVAKRALGAAKRDDVMTDLRAAAFHQPQRVPERLDVRAPFMKVGRVLALLRARHGLASLPERGFNPRCERAKAAVFRPPRFDVLPKAAKIPVDLFPGT